MLLLTAEPPHPGTAGGIVLHRLFQDYPPERLLVMTSVQVPRDDRRLPCRFVHAPLAVDRLQRTRYWPWRNRLSAWGATRLLPLQGLTRTADRFAPGVVVALMQDSWSYTRAFRLARRLRRPLLLLVHDLPHLFEPLSGRLQRQQRVRDAAISRAAAGVLLISEGMKRWFATEYHVNGDVLLPPRSAEPSGGDPADNLNLKQPGALSVGYAGGLHYGYGEQLLRLLPALRATGTKLHLFTDAPAGEVAPLREATDVITFHRRSARPEEAWERLRACCDVVLQPYLDPPGAHALQYRTHFPSKLGDALSLGLPLLVTGPADASGVVWCRARPDSAVVLTAAGEASIQAALLELRRDGIRRAELGRGAQRWASAFDPAGLRAALVDQLRRLVPTAS